MNGGGFFFLLKRFTATEKWDKEWWRDLPPKHKCLWLFLCDRCDAAGVWEQNFGLASFLIGATVKLDDLSAFGDRIEILESGAVLLTRFIAFQYGTLSASCKPHMKVLDALNKHGLDYTPEQSLVVRSRKSCVKSGRKDFVKARDGKCVYCGAVDSLVVDHVHPRRLGGGDEVENLAAACESCNCLKSDRPLSEFLKSHPEKDRIIGYLGTLTEKGTKKGYQERVQEEEEDKDNTKTGEESAERRGGKARGTKEELAAFCAERGLPASDGEIQFDAWEGAGWKNGGKPIVDWKATVRSWQAQGWMPSQKSAQRALQTNGKSSAHARTADDRDFDRTGIKPAHIPTKLL